MTTHVEHVWGTVVSIDVRGDVPDRTDAVEEVVAWLHRVDATFSTYRPESPISRIARGELPLDDAPAVVGEVLARCDELRILTGGYFDVRAGGELDPSGFVKGWAIEAASALLTHRGVVDHCVNAGGDVRTRGVPRPGESWRIGIAHPLLRDALCAVLDVGEGAVATSGTAERGAHVIDPHSGRAALELASVTVVGDDLAVADCYATAALAMGLDAPAWLGELDGYDALVVDAGGYLFTTAGIENRLVTPAAKPA